MKRKEGSEFSGKPRNPKKKKSSKPRNKYISNARHNPKSATPRKYPNKLHQDIGSNNTNQRRDNGSSSRNNSADSKPSKTSVRLSDFLRPDHELTEALSQPELTSPRSSEGDGSWRIADDLEDTEVEDYPYLQIYAGQKGNMELNECGVYHRVKIKEKKYPLPLDTDILQITAYGLMNKGDWSEVRSIGDMVINASSVTLRNCWSLERLPQLRQVRNLKIESCPRLKIIHPGSQIYRAEFSSCGIIFLPKCLFQTQTSIHDCYRLKYIHPAIPDSKISLPDQTIHEMKINYLLSSYATEEEQKIYRPDWSDIAINDPQLETLPACLANLPVRIVNAPQIKYIHPSLMPAQIQGLDPQSVYRCQMQYLFEKEKNDNEFGKWFPIVRARGRDRCDS